jgi:hypothetical protein
VGLFRRSYVLGTQLHKIVPSPLERACPDMSGGWGEVFFGACWSSPFSKFKVLQRLKKGGWAYLGGAMFWEHKQLHKSCWRGRQQKQWCTIFYRNVVLYYLIR